MARKPRNGGVLGGFSVAVGRDRTGWLGRQDSNLGMAESKSDQFAFNIKAHFEKSAGYGPSSVNRLATFSKCQAPSSLLWAQAGL